MLALKSTQSHDQALLLAQTSEIEQWKITNSTLKLDLASELHTSKIQKTALKESESQLSSAQKASRELALKARHLEKKNSLLECLNVQQEADLKEADLHNDQLMEMSEGYEAEIRKLRMEIEKGSFRKREPVSRFSLIFERTNLEGLISEADSSLK